MIISFISLLLTGIFAIIIITALISPFESLGWWAGWYGENEAAPDDKEAQQNAEVVETPPARNYLVYLSGVGAITDYSIPQEEIAWLDALVGRIPGTVLVTDVFPYSVTNAGLTSNRAFSGLWRRVEKMRLKNPMAVSALLVNLRNVFQVTVSADPRFGPIYNYGVAQEIVDALKKHGYPPGSRTPVTMLGWSGGGQISVGTATFLKQMLNAPIYVISIGGVMSDDPGIDKIEHIYHFYGDKDPVQALGGKMYAGRWRIFPQSTWNRAKAENRLTMTSLGAFTHMGKSNYFDWEAVDEEGENHAEITLHAVTGALVESGLLDDPAQVHMAELKPNPEPSAAKSTDDEQTGQANYGTTSRT
jgi:pimeloyl-ACP methyl ester carboxylesterase